MRYVLIWWLTWNGVATGATEFESKELCLDARAALIKEWGAFGQCAAICLPKG